LTVLSSLFGPLRHGRSLYLTWLAIGSFRWWRIRADSARYR